MFSLVGMTKCPQNQRSLQPDINELKERIDALEATSVGMDPQEFLKMTPLQQQTWLEYLSKNKHRVGTI